MCSILNSLKQNERYFLVPNYTMKCRLYPNKENARKIDDAIYAIQCFHNCILWKIFNEYHCTTEKEKKSKDKTVQNETVHFLSISQIGKAETKAKILAEHPIVDAAPAGAITSLYGVKTDIIKSIGKKPIEYQSPTYYNSKHPRTSYSYQETFGKISCHGNKNALYINLAKIGICKLKGWNQNIRFDNNGVIDFLSYININKKKQVGITVSKDNCGDYWICFKLQNVYKPMKENNGKSEGVDVGLKDIAILSDGTKFENKGFKKKEEHHLKLLQRKLSRRQGWSNQDFRKQHKSDKTIQPSKTYQQTQQKVSRLNRKIAWRRSYYNNVVTREIVENNSFIGVETLNVKGMFRNKHLAKSLADAAMGDILRMLKYKSDWHNRIIQPIDMWTPSSKRCSSCGYIMKSMPLNIRDWICPECGVHHDRDVNAAKNIKHFALLSYTKQSET